MGVRVLGQRTTNVTRLRPKRRCMIAMLSGAVVAANVYQPVSCMKLPGVGVLRGVEGRVAKVDGVEGVDAGGRGGGPWCR